MTREELLQVAKPILFNTDMVQAILENRKTETRRKIPGKIKRNSKLGYDIRLILHKTREKNGVQTKNIDYLSLDDLLRCESPFKVNDILHVRETWAVRAARRFDANVNIMFKAGGQESILTFPNARSDNADRDVYDNFLRKWDKEGEWNPSIFMPKAAARIFLKVRDIIPHPIQEMTLDDFLAEGVTLRPEAFNDPENAYQQARHIFAKEIWDKTLKKADREYYSWDANPWVWMICFERIYPA